MGFFQPVDNFLINLFDRCNRYAVGDAVSLLQAAGVNQPAGGFRITKRKAQIDACLRCRPDLSEDMIAIERHDGFRRAGLDVPTKAEAQLEQAVLNRPQLRLRTLVLSLDQCLGVVFLKLAEGGNRDHLGKVGADAVVLLYP